MEMKYVRAAFSFRPDIPGLGTLPLNWIFLAIMLFLALFINAGFLFLGAIIELISLLTLSRSPRFQRLIDSREKATEQEKRGQDPRTKYFDLSTERRGHYDRLNLKAQSVVNTYRDQSSSDAAIEQVEQGINKLMSVYLDLLCTENKVAALEQSGQLRRELERQVEELQMELQRKLSAGVHEAKEKTLRTLQRRLDNMERRAEVLSEVASHLRQIEEEINLAQEQAALGQLSIDHISLDLDVASFLLDDKVIAVMDGTGSGPQRQTY